MATASINLPPYRALRSLDIPDDAAASAAEVPATPLADLSHLATRDELRAGIAGLRTEIVQAAQRQTLWLVGIILATAGLVVAVLRVFRC